MSPDLVALVSRFSHTQQQTKVSVNAGSVVRQLCHVSSSSSCSGSWFTKASIQHSLTQTRIYGEDDDNEDVICLGCEKQRRPRRPSRVPNTKQESCVIPSGAGAAFFFLLLSSNPFDLLEHRKEIAVINCSISNSHMPRKTLTVLAKGV